MSSTPFPGSIEARQYRLQQMKAKQQQSGKPPAPAQPAMMSREQRQRARMAAAANNSRARQVSQWIDEEEDEDESDEYSDGYQDDYYEQGPPQPPRKMTMAERQRQEAGITPTGIQGRISRRQHMQAQERINRKRQGLPPPQSSQPPPQAPSGPPPGPPQPRGAIRQPRSALVRQAATPAPVVQQPPPQTNPTGLKRVVLELPANTSNVGVDEDGLKLYYSMARRDAHQKHREAPLILGDMQFPDVKCHTAWACAGEAMVVYSDIGITPEMSDRIAAAEQAGTTIVYRVIGRDWKNALERFESTKNAQKPVAAAPVPVAKSRPAPRAPLKRKRKEPVPPPPPPVVQEEEEDPADADTIPLEITLEDDQVSESSGSEEEDSESE